MVLSNITNLINGFLSTTQVRPVVQVKPRSNNPFANPFVGSNDAAQSNYGKNVPFTGGYFAGYYNGKPNIVGKRLFIEV